MASELEELRTRAKDLATAAAGRPEGERASRLLDRLGTGQFLVAVAGEFNKGKSTLVDALIGDEAVPTGVLPLTAVATELSFGEPGVHVERLDGTRETVGLDQLHDYVTEAGNPNNTRGVARVELRGRWPLLEPGVVLVDSPGIASLHQHNTEAGRTALLDADGAVVVLSADAPMSGHERELLTLVSERRAPTFFVLNKADHISESELATVRGFVERAIFDALGVTPIVFSVNARAALAARRAGRKEVGADGLEFDEFAEHLASFISDDLVSALATSARNELMRLGASICDAAAMERAAATMDAQRLNQLVERFSGEATRLQRALDDDCTLLNRDTNKLVVATAERLAVFAREAAAQKSGTLSEVAETAPRARLAQELRVGVQAAVEGSFESFRQSEAVRVEQQWHAVAEKFRARTQERVDAIREVAAELFEIPLPRLEIPGLTTQRQRFSYLFIHVGSVNEPIGRALSRLVPGRWARPAALRHARDQLASELDKHAGRARWDVSQRLEEARLEMERSMRDELDGSIEAILQAANRAQQRREVAEEVRARQDNEAEHLCALGASLTALEATN